MDRDEVIDRLRRREADLRRHRVRSLRLFGSVARGEATPGSDVDLLVAFDGPRTFSGFMSLKIFIEDLREELCRHPDPEWYDPTPERHDEPGCPGGLYCPDCDQWLDLPDEATRRGI